jgi:hypothetical protein
MASITSIGSGTRVSVLIEEGILSKYRYGADQDYLTLIRADIKEKATILQKA